MKVFKKYIDIKYLVVAFALFIAISADLNAKSTFSAERIKQYCENYIKANFENIQSIDFLIKFSEIQFDEDGVDAKINILQNQNSSIQKVQLIFSKNDQYLKIVEIPFRLHQIRNVYIAQRDIYPKEAISPNDFIISQYETTVSPDIITNSEQLHKKIAKRTIRKGEILKQSDLESQKIISRGKQVQIEVISGGIKVRTSGTSLDDAGIGEEVRVRRDSDYSKMTVTGKVNDEGIVQIILK